MWLADFFTTHLGADGFYVLTQYTTVFDDGCFFDTPVMFNHPREWLGHPWEQPKTYVAYGNGLFVAEDGVLYRQPIAVFDNGRRQVPGWIHSFENIMYFTVFIHGGRGNVPVYDHSFRDEDMAVLELLKKRIET